MDSITRTILALDLGTHCGFAIGTPGAVVSGAIDFTPKRLDGGGMRYLKFFAFLDKMHAQTPIQIMVLEDVRAHKGVFAAHVYGGLLASATMWAEQNSVPYTGYPVGAIKKHATGKGNASKEMMVAAANRMGFATKNEDEADALCLFHLHAGVAMH